MSAAPVISLAERRRRALDVEDQVLDLSVALVGSAGLSARREDELIAAGNERLRALAEALEQAVIAAVALEVEEAAADIHVQGGCDRCSRLRTVVRGICHGLRRIRTSIDLAHQRYRRAMKRLGRS